jgi:hypothetical protein
LGAVPALGRAHLAPYFGGLLLLVLGYVAARGAIRREPLALAVALFALLAAGLIAIGRAEHSDGQIFSRYYVLSALAWGLAAFMILGRHSHPRRPLQTLVAILPALIFFNAFANREFTDEVDAWITCRDIAAVNFKQHGADGMGPFHLHPRPERATKLLQKAESLGVYRFGAVCLPVPLPSGARTSEQIKYYIEEVATKAGAVSVRGWAAIPEKVSRRGSVHLVLRMGDQTLAFTAVTVPRNDVPTVMKQPGWTNAGFHFARRLDRMPAGDFSIGLLIKDGARAEYVMTGHRLTIPPPARSGLLAAGQ